MQKSDLEAEQKALQACFDDLSKQRNEITDEILRVQGAHRLVNKLLNKLNEDNNGPEPGRTEEPAN